MEFCGVSGPFEERISVRVVKLSVRCDGNVGAHCGSPVPTCQVSLSFTFERGVILCEQNSSCDHFITRKLKPNKLSVQNSPLNELFIPKTHKFSGLL